MSPKSSESHQPNITYFRPDQIVFHVNENLRSAPEKTQALISWAQEHAKDKGIKITLPDTDHVLDFNPQPNPDLLLETIERKKELQTYSGLSYKSPPARLPEPFSLVFLNAQSEKWPDFPSSQIGGQETEEIRNMQAAALNDLLDLIILMDMDENRPPYVESVSPNWLMNGSASSPGSTGGPGGRPTPYDGPASTEQYRFRFDIPEIWNKNPQGGLEQEKVVVAILDTAPKLRDEAEDKDRVLDRIYKEWVADKPVEERHSLIQSLISPDKQLMKVYFDDAVDRPISGVVPDGYIQAEDHDYQMSDHGMFVAGIIHSIAPQAELHLFQVLNRYGVGDIVSIARTLQKIHDDNVTFPKHRLLVNLSLTINLPLEPAHGRNDEMLRKLRAYLYKNKDKDSSSSPVQTIIRICESLYAQGSKVIAAAGNNREKGQARPQACYPAAFPSVLGVAALPINEKPVMIGERQGINNKFKPASYSNRSDRPEWTGITTLGGEEGPEQGILGIYLEEFPESAHNATRAPSSNGWGWWAGTSFATPIISGMAAAVRALMPGIDSMEEAVVEVFRVQPYKTEDYDEDVLYVKQNIGIS